LSLLGETIALTSSVSACYWSFSSTYLLPLNCCPQRETGHIWLDPVKSEYWTRLIDFLPSSHHVSPGLQNPSIAQYQVNSSLYWCKPIMVILSPFACNWLRNGHGDTSLANEMLGEFWEGFSFSENQEIISSFLLLHVTPGSVEDLLKQ
jgi:hypothetical protein